MSRVIICDYGFLENVRKWKRSSPERRQRAPPCTFTAVPYADPPVPAPVGGEREQHRARRVRSVCVPDPTVRAGTGVRESSHTAGHSAARRVCSYRRLVSQTTRVCRVE
eukprot:1308752-Prymnesium_polylepis.1